MNLHYYSEQDCDFFWTSYVYANSDLIHIYQSCLTKQVAEYKAQAFIDGVKFARGES